MIYSFIHPGSGLGNQLFRFIAGKVTALDKGYDYSAIGRENFKGKSFMNLDMGVVRNLDYIVDPSGKIILDDHFDDTKYFEEKTNYYNPEINFVEDGTVIDGEFQSEQYFGHRLREVDRWLKVEPLEIPDDLCVIGFRGGEFYVFPELGLPKEYFAEAKIVMLQKNINMKFEIHTDDPVLASAFLKDIFPEAKIIHDIGINWRSVRHAKYAIIANSSFYILPRLLRHQDPGHRIDRVTGGPFTVAPRYWARRNIKEWSMPQNYYKNFHYI